MNLLQLQNGDKHFGSRTIFDEATFAINDGEHVGVIGPNGAGKTTLFKILIGQEQLDGGKLIKSQQLRIGYLQQEATEPEGISAEEFLEGSSLKPLWELKQLGEGLGLEAKHFASTFADLSGGYRMRMKLLSLIGQEPNLMLLDEPTNFLDLESILALETYLQSYEGAFLLISHDREFLRRTTDHTLEVEAGDITKFPGNIDDYFEEKAQIQKILQAQVANQEAKRKKVHEFVAKFGAKAAKARQAQSRLKSLEKMEKIEIRDVPVRAKIPIPPPIHTGKEILHLDDARLGYDTKTILTKVNLRLTPGNHIGVVGFNGVGKSTLLKSLGGRIPLLSGKLTFGFQVSLSYFAQHVSEDLDLEDTVYDALQRNASKDISRQSILDLAGSLLFSNEATQKKIRVLSGGEKSRVALGQILLQRRPLLLLDEPTNHLDFDTVEALTEALRDYPGTVVVVSHDRSFIGRVANRILEIRDGTAELYPGSYDEYLWSLQKGAWLNRGSSAAKTPGPSNAQVKADAKSEFIQKAPASHNNSEKHHLAQIKDLTRKLQKTEAHLATKNKTLADLNTQLDALSQQGGTSNLGLIQELTTNLSNLYQEISTIESRLLEDMELLEISKKSIS